ncbi:MAG: helix-turn-helix transcriptional regulator [Thermoguttaceae bacterium]|nr:helix-turn-helix transcriptional regulator [Thermoguttaceae bacterium]
MPPQLATQDNPFELFLPFFFMSIFAFGRPAGPAERVGGQYGAGHRAPGAEHSRAERSGRALQYVQGQTRGHAAILNTDLLGYRAAIAPVQAGEPGTAITEGVDFLARFVAKTSPGHLARLFREHFDCSFTEYLRELRMHKAVKLLTGSTQPIGHIAALVGYADPSRFAQHFRRRFGISPRAYRQRFAERRRAGGP